MWANAPRKVGCMELAQNTQLEKNISESFEEF